VIWSASKQVVFSGQPQALPARGSDAVGICTSVRSKASVNVEGSVLIIVLWVALGLVSITLYFANSMTFELRAADNSVSGFAADQAIEGGARYVQSVLSTLATNGTVPDLTSYESEAVPVGDSHFWLIGRAGDLQSQVQPNQVFFGLVDEGSKLNLNTVTADMLNLLTNMTPELAANIVDWRNTNGTTSANGDGPTVYSQFQPAYLCKNAPFETVDELRLVYPMDMGTLLGEDYNRNGTLDPGETDTNMNNVADPGILEYATVYSREPNSGGGAARVNVSVLAAPAAQLRALLQTNLSAGRLNQVMTRLGLVTAGPTGGPGRGNPGGGPGSTPGGGGPGQGGGAAVATFASPLAFYVRSGMTSDEFAPIANSITVSSGSFTEGRINVNTAPAAVLSCLPGISSDTVQQLLAYRQTNPDKLTSIAWVVDALGSSGSALTRLGAGDYITTKSYQFSADIAALGPYGRGYRRVKYVFDTSSGTPQIVYRQDLSYLGWALGKNVRQAWLLAKDTR
jgi:type II secretory pathway component PulK